MKTSRARTALAVAALWKRSAAATAAEVRTGAERSLDERAFTSEIAMLLTISERAAQNLIGVSRALDESLPSTLAALSRGEISYRHAQIMVDQALGLAPECEAALEAKVLPLAAAQTPPRFTSTVRKARERLHPETITARHEAAMDERTVALEECPDGMMWISNKTDAATALAVFDKLSGAARALKKNGDQRSLANLRSDIMASLMLVKLSPIAGEIPDVPEIDGIEKVAQLKNTDAFVRWFAGVSARVVVTVPALSLLGESSEPATLEGYGPVPLELAKRLTARAPSLCRVFTHPETGATLSVGRKRYKIPEDLRMFLAARDETCRFPGCNRQAASSDLDHTHEWHELGATAHTTLLTSAPGTTS